MKLLFDENLSSKLPRLVAVSLPDRSMSGKFLPLKLHQNRF
jgi:hypothetical protein